MLVVDIHGRRAEHVDQPAVAVEGESGIARLLGKPFDRRIGKSQIKDGVHHTRHRECRAGANADQKGVGRIAELLA